MHVLHGMYWSTLLLHRFLALRLLLLLHHRRAWTIYCLILRNGFCLLYVFGQEVIEHQLERRLPILVLAFFPLADLRVLWLERPWRACWTPSGRTVPGRGLTVGTTTV